MKKFLSTSAAALMLAATITSCQKEEVMNTTPVTPAGKTATETENILRWMAENMQEKNLGNGAILVREDLNGMSFGVSRNVVIDWETFTFISGEFASFGAEPGAGDFKRYNPDGTVTLKLVSNSATGSYEDVSTGEYYTGPGNANFRFTGTEVTFEVPFPPFTLTFVLLDASSNALVVHGQSNQMTLNGEPGPNHSLQMTWMGNPGGQGGTDFTFN